MAPRHRTAFSAAFAGFLALITSREVQAQSAPEQAKSNCQLVELAELPFQLDHNRPLITIAINGQPARFQLDTGASESILFFKSAKRLALDLHARHDVRFAGARNQPNVFSGNIPDFELGKFHAQNIKIMVLDRSMPGGVDGLIGEDILARSDLDIDFPEHVIKLMSSEGCKGDEVVYWNKAYSVTPLTWGVMTRDAVITVSLNGKTIRAQLDTGASATTVTVEAAADAGFRPGSAELKSAGLTVGIGSVEQTYSAVFPNFSIGDETIKNAKINIANFAHASPLIGSSFPQMLLGDDFFSSHRVYIARKQKLVYVSYMGGMVFQDPNGH